MYFYVANNVAAHTDCMVSLVGEKGLHFIDPSELGYLARNDTSGTFFSPDVTERQSKIPCDLCANGQASYRSLSVELKH